MTSDRNARASAAADGRPYVGPRTRGAVVSDIAHTSCLEAPPMLPPGEWWEGLEDSFYKRSENFDLAWFDQVKVQTTAALDVVIRTGAALGLSLLAAPSGFNPLELRRAREDEHFYAPFVKANDPGRFFTRPEGRVTVRVKRTTKTTFQPHDGICENIRWESTFEPRNPRLRKGWQQHEKNRYAHVRYWRHRDGPRPTVVAIHGFGAEGYALNQWFFGLPWMYETLGLDVALFNLPFHGKRQTRFSPFSGHGFFAGGISRINEAFAQAVHDFRTLLDYLGENRGVNEVGVTGISLGGFTTALLASVEPRLRFAIPNVPVASLADLVLEWEPLGTIVRGALKALGMDLVQARRMLAVSCPLTWRPVLPRQRLMVIGGVGDRLAPPTHTRLLWDHWQRPRLHWFPGSHVIHVERTEYLNEMAKFFDEIGFAHR